MSEVLERARKALADAYFASEDRGLRYDDLDREQQLEWTPIVVAVLGAIRQPSDVMIDAVVAHMPTEFENERHREAVRRDYVAMIDAALKQ